MKPINLGRSFILSKLQLIRKEIYSEYPDESLLILDYFQFLPGRDIINEFLDYMINSNYENVMKEVLKYNFCELISFTPYYPGKKLPSDYKERAKISNMIGLSEVPKADPHAIKRLSGIFAHKIKLDKVDSIELIREVRGS